MMSSKSSSTSLNPTEIENNMAGKKAANPNETRDQKLRRLVEKSVPRILKGIDNLGGWAKFNPNVKQRDYVFELLKKHIEAAHQRWTTGEKPQGDFQFPS